MPMVAHDFERAFAVDLLLQSPQRFFNGLAFFQLNFCQTNSLPLRMIWGRAATMAGRSASVRVEEGIFGKGNVNRQKPTAKDGKFNRKERREMERRSPDRRGGNSSSRRSGDRHSAVAAF